MKMILSFTLLVLGSECLGGCSGGEQHPPATGRPMGQIELTSPVFSFGGTIPLMSACDGDDFSPPLAWENVPDSVKSFALICDDPDAPAGTWVHWVIFNIPDTVKELPQAMPKTDVTFFGATQGKNDFGRIGYNGPCPPPGKPHRYFFRLFALDTMLPPTTHVERNALERLMQGHIVGSGELVGRYSIK